ncbi:MAG: hypothetical protein M3R03_05530 [Pseudomonadota bacterium]|nr:hypothetical protein [Pseudomonadota bacterium]
MELEGLWGLATIIGPIVLLALFIWVILRNRSAPVSKDVTDAATRANYQADDRAAKNDEI